jgi:hypothetical protein
VDSALLVLAHSVGASGPQQQLTSCFFSWLKMATQVAFRSAISLTETFAKHGRQPTCSSRKCLLPRYLFGCLLAGGCAVSRWVLNEDKCANDSYSHAAPHDYYVHVFITTGQSHILRYRHAESLPHPRNLTQTPRKSPADYWDTARQTRVGSRNVPVIIAICLFAGISPTAPPTLNFSVASGGPPYRR